jgi:hypothetical protein
MADERRAHYGIVLALILADVAVVAASPETGWWFVLTVALHCTTLLACLHAAGVSRRIQRLTAGVVLLAFASVVGSRIGAGSDPGLFARTVNGALVALAPLVIARDLWSHPRITGRTVAGALCIYLLVGMLFASLLAIVEAAGEPVFAGVAEATDADRLYFSFVTLTTTGYGDLSPAAGPARALAVMEALLGQLYLVTVVAVLVSRAVPLRSGRRRERG